MKFKLLLLVLSVVFTTSCSAQSFFKPIPLPGPQLKATATATNPLIQNNIRPLLDVTATVLGGTSQLAGGFGIGLQHNKFDAVSNAWITQYSVSAIAFIGTNGKTISGTGGLALGIPGTNGLIQVGPGYDFTNKQFVILTGIGIKFN